MLLSIIILDAMYSDEVYTDVLLFKYITKGHKL